MTQNELVFVRGIAACCMECCNKWKNCEAKFLRVREWKLFPFTLPLFVFSVNPCGFVWAPIGGEVRYFVCESVTFSMTMKIIQFSSFWNGGSNQYGCFEYGWHVSLKPLFEMVSVCFCRSCLYYSSTVPLCSAKKYFFLQFSSAGDNRYPFSFVSIGIVNFHTILHNDAISRQLTTEFARNLCQIIVRYLLRNIIVQFWAGFSHFSVQIEGGYFPQMSWAAIWKFFRK